MVQCTWLHLTDLEVRVRASRTQAAGNSQYPFLLHSVMNVFQCVLQVLRGHCTLDEIMGLLTHCFPRRAALRDELCLAFFNNVLI